MQQLTLNNTKSIHNKTGNRYKNMFTMVCKVIACHANQRACTHMKLVMLYNNLTKSMSVYTPLNESKIYERMIYPFVTRD